MECVVPSISTDNSGESKIVESSDAISSILDSISGVNFPKVVAVTGSENKADWLRAMLVGGPWDQVKVWEDSLDNIEMLDDVVEQFNHDFQHERPLVTYDYVHIK